MREMGSRMVGGIAASRGLDSLFLFVALWCSAVSEGEVVVRHALEGGLGEDKMHALAMDVCCSTVSRWSTGYSIGQWALGDAGERSVDVVVQRGRDL